MDASVAAQRDMVGELRSQGATVAINHPMVGMRRAPSRSCRQRLIRTKDMGAQLIEVGTAMNPGSILSVCSIQRPAMASC